MYGYSKKDIKKERKKERRKESKLTWRIWNMKPQAYFLFIRMRNDSKNVNIQEIFCFLSM